MMGANTEKKRDPSDDPLYRAFSDFSNTQNEKTIIEMLRKSYSANEVDSVKIGKKINYLLMKL